MDINAALERMRQLAELNPSSELAIVFDGIDGWLSTGGFLPDAWMEGRHF